MKNMMNILMNVLAVLLWADDAEEMCSVGFADTGTG